MRRLGLILILLALLPGLAGAQERSVAPGVNRSYENPDFAGWRAVFENEGREIHEHRHAIVEALAIRPGMVVADVGAGTGIMSLLFAEKVGAGGTAIAQDIAPGFLRENHVLEFRRPRAGGRGFMPEARRARANPHRRPASCSRAG